MTNLCGRFAKDTTCVDGSDRTLAFTDEFLTAVYEAAGHKIRASGKRLKNFGLLHVFDKDSFPDSDKADCGFTKTKAKADCICVFGLGNGKAGQENKFEFPPPIDTDIFYGTLCLVKVECTNDSQILMTNLSVSQWEATYAKLFGGFFDCDASDGSDEDDCDEEDEIERTKEGYAKDGFVVSDDEDEDDDIEWSEEEEFEFSDEE